MKLNFYKFLVFAFCGICLLPSKEIFAQTDTVFWFAAPYQTMYDQGGRYIDRPIVFGITTGNQPANVTISQPANGGMPSLSLTIPANTTQAVNVSQWLDDIQNNPPNTTLNYGVKIISNVPITAYYEILSDSLQGGGSNPPNEKGNPETFSLKGHEALGENFVIPFQNEYSNDTLSASYARRNCFVIVATENNTQVTIKPSHNIVGHAAGVAFNLNLNKGQSYSATSTDASAADHLIASTVTSNKPIAITVYDDFLRYIATGSDNAGDQIVPNDLLGTEYIALNGWSAQPSLPPSSYGSYGDDLYITATVNNTNVSINGTPTTTLNSEQTYHANMSGEDAAYINTSHPVTIWQLSGVSSQAGGTQVPKLLSTVSSCTGGQSVSYARTLEGPILFNVVVPNGGQNAFTINGNPNTLTGTMFSAVPGTNGNWLYCRLDLQDPSATSYPVGNIIKISNATSNFQLSVLEGSRLPNLNVWGATLGYFTGYDEVNVSNADSNILGHDTTICPGDHLTLNADIPGATNYQWSNGDTTSSITIDSPGTYWVHIDGSFCGIDDTIHVFSKPNINGLGNDTSICAGAHITLNATTPGALGYQWSTGDTTSSISVDSPGTYWVFVEGKFCKNSDTIVISLRHLPPVDIGNDTTICQGSQIILNSNATSPATELWNTGAITPSIIVKDSGIYWVEVHYPDCGDIGDTIAVGLVKCNCSLGIPSAFSPNGDGRNDIFKPVIAPGCTLKKYDFQVYNRYGQLIFQSFDPAKGWDGLEFGKPADLGVYMYYLVYRGVLDDKSTVRKGDVTLIR